LFYLSKEQIGKKERPHTTDLSENWGRRRKTVFSEILGWRKRGGAVISTKAGEDVTKGRARDSSDIERISNLTPYRGRSDEGERKSHQNLLSLNRVADTRKKSN